MLVVAVALAVAVVGCGVEPVRPEAGATTQTRHWYAWQVEGGEGVSYTDMSGWLDVPAGRRGRVRIDGDVLKYADDTRATFWGVNLCNGRVAAEEETGRRWADYLARHGVNAVRFHKFTYAARGDGREGIGRVGGPSTDYDPELLDATDRFVSQLKARGIHVGLSPIYGHRVEEGDRGRLLAYDEVAKLGSTAGLVNFAPDLQDLHIELVTNLLNHRNPYTGLRWADDPAVIFVELQNEDDLFWGHTKSAVDAAPTYRTLLEAQFSDWLKRKYGGHAGLVAAWGEAALDRGETLERRNIGVVPHPWWYGAEGFEKQGEAKRRRLVDAAAFLHQTQNAWYRRFTRAIRETGYDGPIIASNWQAGDGLPHLLNLRSDALVGIVDRHAYTGGGTGHRLRPGRFKAGAMVDRPGSGLLSAGLNRVTGRPFALSEWMACPPNEWIAEGPPLVAMYGMGLQGWDMSFAFASNYPHYTDTVEAPWVYNADAATQLGQSPALARMLYRGDVERAERVAERRVGVGELMRGEVEGWRVEEAALAVGPVATRFVEGEGVGEGEGGEETGEGGNRVVSKRGEEVVSATGELRWRPATASRRGRVTIDTAGTQGVVGFAAGETVSLGDVTIEPRTAFVSLLVTSREREAGIAQAGVAADHRGGAGAEHGDGVRRGRRDAAGGGRAAGGDGGGGGAGHAARAGRAAAEGVGAGPRGAKDGSAAGCGAGGGGLGVRPDGGGGDDLLPGGVRGRAALNSARASDWWAYAIAYNVHRDMIG